MVHERVSDRGWPRGDGDEDPRKVERAMEERHLWLQNESGNPAWLPVGRMARRQACPAFSAVEIGRLHIT